MTNIVIRRKDANKTFTIETLFQIPVLVQQLQHGILGSHTARTGNVIAYFTFLKPAVIRLKKFG